MATSADSPTAGELSNPDGAPQAPVEEQAETNFPVAEPEETTDEITEPTPEPEGAEGEIWATYIGPGSDRVERILTVKDLKGLGDKDASEDLRWDASNRHRVEVTDAHPMVIRYLEENDPGFKVERF